MHWIVAPEPSEEAVPSIFGIKIWVADIDLGQRDGPRIAPRLGLEVDRAHRCEEVVHRVARRLASRARRRYPSTSLLTSHDGRRLVALQPCLSILGIGPGDLL